MKINSEFDLNISINFYEKYLDSCIYAIFEISEETNFNDDNIKKRIKQLKEDYTKISNNLDEDNKFDYIELTNLFDIDDYESRPDINNHFSYYKSSVNSIILSMKKNSKESNLLKLLSKKSKSIDENKILKELSESNDINVKQILKIENIYKNKDQLHQYVYLNRAFSTINMIMNILTLYYTKESNLTTKSAEIFKGLILPTTPNIIFTNINEVILTKMFYVLIYNVVKLSSNKFFIQDPEVQGIFDDIKYFINNKNIKFFEQNISEINKLFLNINKCFKAFIQIGNHFDFYFSKETKRISSFYNVRLI